MSGSYIKPASISSEWLEKSPSPRDTGGGGGTSDPLTDLGIPYTAAYGLYEASGIRARTLGSSGPSLFLDSVNPVGSTAGLHGDLSSYAVKGVGVKPFLSMNGESVESISPLTDSWSMSFFYTCTSGDTLAPLIWIEDDTTTTEAIVQIYDRYNLSGLKLGFYVRDNTGVNATVQIVSPGTSRYHMVVQIDKSAGLLRMWVDTVAQTPTAWTGGSVDFGDAGQGLMMLHASPTYASTSTLQDLVIYNGLWTSDHVIALYNSGNSIDLSP